MISNSGPLVTTTVRTPSSSESWSGRASAPQNPAQVVQPDDKNASSVRSPASAGAKASASPLGVVPPIEGADTESRSPGSGGPMVIGTALRDPATEPLSDPRLPSRVHGNRRIPDADTEIVQRLQDVGVTPQQARDEHREECDHGAENDGKSNHATPPTLWRRLHVHDTAARAAHATGRPLTIRSRVTGGRGSGRGAASVGPGRLRLASIGVGATRAGWVPREPAVTPWGNRATRAVDETGEL